MADLGNFNADEHEPLDDFSPIPAGDYLAILSESEVKATKDGQGHYLKLTFEILEGEYKGRKLWSQLNLHNKNATAVKIAQSELSSICRAVKVMQPKDSCELHNLPLLIKVKLKKREDTGEMQNEIKGYESKGKQSAPPVNKSTADAGKAPWMK